MSDEMNINQDNDLDLDLDDLENVTGGGKYLKGATHDELHNLDNFESFTVCNVVHYDSTACLTMRMTPGGAIIPGVGWQNGQRIKVNKFTKNDAWVFSYKGKYYGYVNRDYINFKKK